MGMPEETAAHKAWLKTVKPGDTVAIRSWGVASRRVYTLVEVKRLTTTQIVVTRGSGTEHKYRRNDGGAVGQSYGPELVAYDQSVMDAMRVANVEDRFRWHTVHKANELTLADKEAMLAAYDALRSTEKAIG